MLVAVPAFFLLDKSWQNGLAANFAEGSTMFWLLDSLGVLGMLLVLMMVGLATHFIRSGIKSGERIQLHRYYAMLILFAANILFWALFEQAGSSLNFLARDYVDMPTIFGYQLHFTIFQSVNPVFIILLAPVFAAMWPWLDKKSMNPSIPRKFAIGLAGAAIGFYVLVFALQNMANEAGRISWVWLTLTYLIHTIGELCLSPIGLAMVTKLALPKETGLAMGGWFLSIAMANYVAGLLAAEAAGGGEAAGTLTQYASVFDSMFVIGIITAAAYFLLAPLINKLMHGVK